MHRFCPRLWHGKEMVSKICDYCGKESEVDAFRCAECGTAFPSVGAAGAGAPSEPTSPAAKGPTLGAKTATIILLAYLAAQFTVGALAGNAMLALLVILSALASPRQKPVSDGGRRGQSC